jgi:hypothetical protein
MATLESDEELAPFRKKRICAGFRNESDGSRIMKRGKVKG